jgi:hypothetical protein
MPLQRLDRRFDSPVSGSHKFQRLPVFRRHRDYFFANHGHISRRHDPELDPGPGYVYDRDFDARPDRNGLSHTPAQD